MNISYLKTNLWAFLISQLLSSCIFISATNFDGIQTSPLERADETTSLELSEVLDPDNSQDIKTFRQNVNLPKYAISLDNNKTMVDYSVIDYEVPFIVSPTGLVYFNAQITTMRVKDRKRPVFFIEKVRQQAKADLTNSIKIISSKIDEQVGCSSSLKSKKSIELYNLQSKFEEFRFFYNALNKRKNNLNNKRVNRQFIDILFN